MRFSVQYPTGVPGWAPEFVQPAVITTFAGLVERLGFNAIAFTEHPAPTRRWLDAGGHEGIDPLTALAFCAATTTSLELMTYLLVLPYRNPMLAAKQIATLDVLSQGRTILACGAGYLRSEFTALGVDFDERNELFDEALAVLSTVWRSPEFTFQGRHFTTKGQVSSPRPAQLPHPPIWIGGNSRVARQRVAKYGQGWTPLLADEALTKITRTATIDSLDALRRAIDDLYELLAAEGRLPGDVEVQVMWRAVSELARDQSAAPELLSQLEGAGVTRVLMLAPGHDVQHSFDVLERFGETVVAEHVRAAAADR